jgi:hypothetical protein
MTENYFNSIKKYLKDCTDPMDHPLLQKMDELYSHIFLLCKQGDFEAAQTKLVAADERFDLLVKSTKVEDHVNILRLPIIAYLYFKLDDFQKAEQYLNDSIQASIQLDTIHPSFFLEMFRVQQQHNNARIEFKKQAYPVWALKMKQQFDEILAHDLPLSGDEISVYAVMVDQLIYEVIVFCEYIKEDKYLKEMLENLSFQHSLFSTHESLKKLKNWCLVQSKVYAFHMDFLNSYEHVETILNDRSLKELYRKSLLKSVAPYVSDQVFLDYLDLLTGKKLIS